MLYHPWRSIRMLPDWRVVYRDLPADVMGYTHRPSRTVVIATGLDQAERRCTLAHELEHVAAGHHGCQPPNVERDVSQRAARRLIPLEHLIDALLWVRHRWDEREIAANLWVDVDTLRCRLDNLTEDERAEIELRLERERRTA